ncbi:MAG: transporter substrate-binding domain-containing protein, partial [Treponema sp.]|nr:transporter substrate-binding domain-containing protein [Treponema sp.]
MSKLSGRKICLMFVFTLILPVFSGCGKPLQNQEHAATGISFRDIPGVTQGEIDAVEALKKKYGSFVFGTGLSTRAFIGKNGEIEGYTPMFCEWLTEIFGIPFRPAFYEWGALLKGLESGEVDFTNEVMP